jgi:hypothetical protein
LHNTDTTELRFTKTKKMTFIGIDTGKHTGIAVYRHGFISIETTFIHNAMEAVLALHLGGEVFVRVEDARLRKWLGNKGREALQGAGSIKRDASIWEDFLTDKGIPFEMVAPRNNATKLSAETFRNITGWQGRTSEHSRDAAMLVYKMEKISPLSRLMRK